MKVTKLIREHVEECVNKAYPFDDNSEYNIVHKRVSDAAKIVDKEVKKFSTELIDKLKAEYEIPEDWNFQYSGYNPVSWRGYGTRLWEENQHRVRNIENQRKTKIKEILIELELGANRDELNAILSKLCDEVKE